MAKTKQNAREKVCRYEQKKWDEDLAEHVRLEMVGELPAVTISWKKRMAELVQELAGKSWEVVEDLRDESKSAIVCPICTLEIGEKGRQAPSVVPCHLFKVHLARTHEVVGDIYLTCPKCNKIPGWASVPQVESHYEQGGCVEQVAGGEAEQSQIKVTTPWENMWKGVLKSELVRSVRALQVWEVERVRPGQILVACPVCKLEKRRGVRVHESMVKSNQLKSHFEQEHKPQKFLLKSRILKCPNCQDFIPAGLLGVHFDQGRSCEKAVALAEKVQVPIKEEGSEVKMEIGGAKDPEAGTSSSTGEEYMELINSDHKIKLEGGAVIKTEAVEEFYGVEEMHDEDVPPQISREEILKEIPPNARPKYQEVFQIKELTDEYIQTLVQKYLVDTDQPVTLLKRLTTDVFYKYQVQVAGAWGPWKCWITCSSGVNICASDAKKKGAMRKVAIKALSQLFNINHSQSS